MSGEIFQEGGPLNIEDSGSDEYQMSIDIPTDEDGMFGRECPHENCSPGYFKVKPGTGITEDHEKAFCPYCRKEDEPGGFTTQAQQDYAIALVENEVIKGVNQMIEKSFGFGPSKKKKMGGDLLSVEMSYKPSKERNKPRLFEEELRRDVTCSNCGLEHSVFGLATWCPDCGKDIFLIHVYSELNVVKRMLSVIDTRFAELGSRVAGKDVENALEDTVSIFEAVLKIITDRYLSRDGMNSDEIIEVIQKKVRNKYQNTRLAGVTFLEQVGIDLYEGISEIDLDLLRVTFEKRHPITHNLGIVDRKYIERVRTGELEGREIRVTADDVLKAIEIISKVISTVYQKAFI